MNASLYCYCLTSDYLSAHPHTTLLDAMVSYRVFAHNPELTRRTIPDTTPTAYVVCMYETSLQSFFMHSVEWGVVACTACCAAHLSRCNNHCFNLVTDVDHHSWPEL